jgi:hypothetical protein
MSCRFKYQLLLALTFVISACGRPEVRLADDPGQEVVQPSPDNGSGGAPKPDDGSSEPDYTDNQESQILKNYEHFDPQNLINDKLLKAAKLYFHNNKSNFRNQKYVTVIDYSLSSKKQRLFMIDTVTGSVWPTYVAHGKGSDADHDGYAERFSNESGSNATSLGAFKTAETYYGSNGYSLRLDGLSSTNSNARSRAIVVHGASYVQDRSVIQGRSWGCPAVATQFSKNFIDTIKGGSLIFAGASAQL